MVSLVRPCVSFFLSLIAFPFFDSVSFVVSTQNLILIAVDRFGAVVFPLHSPLIRSKLCPFFILATRMFAVVFISPDLLAFELVEYPEGVWCVRRWKKVFGESLSLPSLLLAHGILFTYIPMLLLVILYSIIFIKLKTQAHPGEQSTNNQQQRKRKKQKRPSNVHCNRNSVRALLVNLQ